MRKDIFSEEELRQAAKKVRDAKLSTIPTELETPSVSEEFKEKMGFLFRKERRIHYFSIIRRGVAVALIALIVGAVTLLATNDDARAKVNIWFKNMTQMHSFFEFEGAEDSTLQVYKPTWIPEGYEYAWTEEQAVDVHTDEHGKQMKTVLNRRLHYICVTDQTKELALQYGTMEDGNSLHLRTDDGEYDIQEVRINGMRGELYKSLDSKISSGIVWFDEENQVYYLAVGYLSSEELIQFAESVCVEK